MVLELPYIDNKSHIIEIKIKELKRKTYNTVNPRRIFISQQELVPRGTYLIQQKGKIFVVYKFECYSDNSYIGQTSRHLKTRIKEHVPKCVKL